MFPKKPFLRFEEHSGIVQDVGVVAAGGENWWEIANTPTCLTTNNFCLDKPAFLAGVPTPWLSVHRITALMELSIYSITYPCVCQDLEDVLFFCCCCCSVVSYFREVSGEIKHYGIFQGVSQCNPKVEFGIKRLNIQEQHRSFF